MRYSYDYACIRTNWSDKEVIDIKDMVPALIKLGGDIDRAVDDLSGLKENVIMGRLVPAGSGLKDYRIN